MGPEINALATHQELLARLASDARSHPNGPYACPAGGLHYGYGSLRLSVAAEHTLRAADLDKVYAKVTAHIAATEPHLSSPEHAPVGTVAHAWNVIVKTEWTDELGALDIDEMGRTLADRLGVSYG